MIVHIVDGTYELFRYFFAVPSHLTKDNREVGGTRGVVGSMQTSARTSGMARPHPEDSLFRVTVFQVPKNWATRRSVP